jgi:hypothetical protein
MQVIKIVVLVKALKVQAGGANQVVIMEVRKNNYVI